jgi:quinol monooxygenase YgiN
MIVHYTFHIHPDHKQQVRDELRKLKAVIERHGGRNLRYYASMMSGTPNRLFIYDIDSFAHFDSLNRDPDFRAITLDSLYSHAAGTIWGEVTL